MHFVTRDSSTRWRSQENASYSHASARKRRKTTLYLSASVRTAERSTISMRSSQVPISRASRMLVWRAVMPVSSDKFHPTHWVGFFIALVIIKIAFAKICNLYILLSMLSTIHRRHILSFLESHEKTNFEALKKAFVETKDMNTTTLYRIIEAFKKEWILHEIEIDRERILITCHSHADEWVKLSYCMNCRDISESHFPLAPDAIKSEQKEYLKHCPKCL